MQGIPRHGEDSIDLSSSPPAIDGIISASWFRLPSPTLDRVELFESQKAFRPASQLEFRGLD
jgi:hypothetical protein